MSSIVSTKIRHPVSFNLKLFSVDFVVVAIHDHAAADEVSVHLQSKVDGVSCFNLVLRGPDRTFALLEIAAGRLVVGAPYNLQLA